MTSISAWAARPAHRSVTPRCLTYLADQQREDGFPPDWSSSRLHTLFRVRLAAARGPSCTPGHVRRMLERTNVLLRKACNEDGGWGRQAGEASDVTSTTYGLIAVCGQDDPGAAVDAADFLPAARREDGGISATSDSIGPRPFIFAVPSLAEVFTLLALGHLVTAPHSWPTGCRPAHDRQHGDGPVAVHWGGYEYSGRQVCPMFLADPDRRGRIDVREQDG